MECNHNNKDVPVDFNVTENDVEEASKHHSEWIHRLENKSAKLGVVKCSNCGTKNHTLIIS